MIKAIKRGSDKAKIFQEMIDNVAQRATLSIIMKHGSRENPTNIRLSNELKERIKKIAGVLDVTVSDVIRLSIINHLPQLEEKSRFGVCAGAGLSMEAEKNELDRGSHYV